MPLSKTSLRVTEAYRARMVGIRDRAKAEATRTWAGVRLSDLDETYKPGALVLHVAMLQREAARLSAGYLGAFIASETGKPIPLPKAVALRAGQSRTGAELGTALRAPLIGVKTDIGRGVDPDAALNRGGVRLARMVGLATDEAAREALRLAMEEAPEVEGYQRAVRGTCPACMGLADASTLPAGTPLEVHPDCQCVAEPAVKPRFPGEALKGREFPRRLFEHGGSVPEPWTEEDLLAVQQYVGHAASFEINHYLRHGEVTGGGDLADMELWTEWMDGAIEHAGPVGREWTQQGFRMGDRPIRAYRGIPGLPDETPVPTDRGKSFSDRAFGSTTSAREYAEWWITEGSGAGPGTIWELDIDPRVKALWGANPGESELILQRDVRYVIREKRKIRGKDQWLIKADVLPPE